MNRTSLALVIPLILLFALVTTPISVTEDIFARNGHHTGDLSQTASISNSCLNPVSNSNTNDNMISNGNCGGTVSQQGRSEQASTPTTVQNANPTIEVQRSTTAQPPPLTTTGGNCTACFDPLTPAQKAAFERVTLPRIFAGIANITTIEQMCAFLPSLSPAAQLTILDNIKDGLLANPVNANFTTAQSIESCMGIALNLI